MFGLGTFRIDTLIGQFIGALVLRPRHMADLVGGESGKQIHNLVVQGF